MTETLLATPSSVPVNAETLITGTGYADHKTRLLLDGTVAATVCYPDSAGNISGKITIGAVAGTETVTVEQLISGAWTAVAGVSVSITVTAATTRTPSAPLTITTSNHTIEDKIFDGTLPDPSWTTSHGAAISVIGPSAASMITNIIIRRCTFRGLTFGILAQYVDTFTFEDCDFEDIDYAAIAGFSVQNGTIQRNNIARVGFVKNPSTGFQGNNAYGIMLNRTESASVITDPPSNHVDCDYNTVDNVPLWQGINSHGGDHLRFRFNHVTRCPRGMFHAQSPKSGGGTSDPTNMTVDSNVVLQSNTRPGGTTDNTGITYAGWSGTSSIQHNRIGSSFTNNPSPFDYGGLSTGVTLSDNLVSGV